MTTLFSVRLRNIKRALNGQDEALWLSIMHLMDMAEGGERPSGNAPFYRVGVAPDDIFGGRWTYLDIIPMANGDLGYRAGEESDVTISLEGVDQTDGWIWQNYERQEYGDGLNCCLGSPNVVRLFNHRSGVTRWYNLHRLVSLNAEFFAGITPRAISVEVWTRGSLKDKNVQDSLLRNIFVKHHRPNPLPLINVRGGCDSGSLRVLFVRPIGHFPEFIAIFPIQCDNNVDMKVDDELWFSRYSMSRAPDVSLVRTALEWFIFDYVCHDL